MTIRSEDVDTIASGGGEVRTSTGEKLGKIGQVYLDDDSGDPSWVTVKTGLFGMQESFVPLTRADVEGADVVVPYDKDTIKGAPRVDTDGSLTPAEEKRLYSYYLDADTIRVDRDDDSGGASRAVDRDRDRSSVLPGHGNDTDDDRLGDDRDRLGNDRDRLGNDRDRDDRDRDDRDGDDRIGSDRSRDDDRLGDDDQQDEPGTKLRKYIVTEKVVSVSREELPGEDASRT